MLRGRTLPAALAALAFLLALIQRPGLASSDTKIDLHVDPGGFLADVASAWSETGDLGHVQGGQYGGYLFPMGPFFALGHWLGVAPWLVQRLWLGLILALAAWGAVRLMDELAGHPRGLAHAVTGLLVLLNPYVVVFSARTSVTLLGYAALPWLLVCVHRGLRSSGWWWPAAFALVVTASGGGVNAAVTAWVLAGPLLLALYERWTGAVEWRAILGFGWRTALATGLVSAWWVVPLLVQSRFGVDFLRFTEQPGTIWATTSLPESLRLMGYWISYLGVGYGGGLRPYFGDGGVLLFLLPVVVAGTLVPALALTGFAWTRRHPHAPFALALVLFGLIVMTVGFPEGTPLRKASNFTYNHVVAVQFLRTTYKAGPLVALGLAMLVGLAAAHRHGRAVAAAALLLAVLACWPLVRGRGLDDQLLWKRVPAAWQAAADHVDETAGDGRAVVLPGQLYAYYDWGGTIDPILPTLAERPVAVRNAVGYADLHAVDLLWTTDALVQQRRALPGQLDPLLDLLGARTVVAGADDDRARSGAAGAAEAADMLDQLGTPAAEWGSRRGRARTAGTLGAPRQLADVRAWDRPQAPGLVRLEPVAPQTVVDGSAEGVAGLAALGTTTAGLAYAGDLAAAAIRDAAEVVITDSNRRRVLVPSRMAQNAGPTLAAAEEPSVDAAVLDPFPERGTDGQTVAVYSGIAGLQAPSSPGFPQFPERRAFAALDGDPATHWQADRALTQDRHTLDVTFLAPRDIGSLDLLPYDDRRATVTAVEVQGRRFAVRPGWNRLRVGLRGVRSLRVRIAAVRKPEGPRAGAGGIRELRIPGVEPREALRVPVVAERALAGRDVSRTGLTYLFQRTTGDDPFRRDPWRGSAGATLVRDRLDGERGLARAFAPPAARTWALDGWASAAADAADSDLDRLAGRDAGFESSARFQGRPGFRASSAFDQTGRPWIGSWLEDRNVWLEWTTPDPSTVTTFTVVATPGVRRPTQVRLRTDAGDSPALAVGAGGVVRLPQPLRGRRFRLEILRAAFAPGSSGVVRQRRAVGIAELEGPGIPRAQVPRSGLLSRACGALGGSVGGRRVQLRADATIADLDAGRPLRVSGCEPLSLPAGAARLELAGGPLAPYLIRLRSAAATSRPAAAPGRLVSAGTAARGGRREGIRLDLDGPARLVLAESYNRGRRATCDGRDLGAPEIGATFGTAWRVPASCRSVAIAFAPTRLVNAGYLLSLVVGVLLLGLLVARRAPGRGRVAAGWPAAASGAGTPPGAAGAPPGAARGRVPAGTPAAASGAGMPPAAAGAPPGAAGGRVPAGTPAAAGAPPGAAGGRVPAGTPAAAGAPPGAAGGRVVAGTPPAGVRAMPVRRAALIAAGAGLALGFVFAARATPLFAVGVFVILWRGLGPRELALAGGAVLAVAVPILTVLIRPDDRGGYNPEYASDRIVVHWVAVAGVALLIIALARELSLSRARERPDRARSAPPSDAGPPGPAP